MKGQIEQLIDRLASKELTFGCVMANPHAVIQNPTQHGILVRKLTDGFNLTDGKGRLWLGHKDHVILGHPIRIGDVLEKVGRAWTDKVITEGPRSGWSPDLTDQHVKLLELWSDCGFNKSLQEIFAEVEWQDEGTKCDHVVCNDVGYRGGCQLQIPKQPSIRELFESLLTLGL